MIRGVSFDLDGTLYAPRAVAWRLLRHAGFRPRALRVLRVGRAVREELRGRAFDDGAAMLAEEARVVAERLEVSPEQARATVDDVYDRALAAALRDRPASPALRAALARLVEGGVALAVVSDRRVDDKLAALGLGDLPWKARLSADVTGLLKPSPEPFLRACAAMGVAPGEAAHVGDRDDTDGAGARAAGMRFVAVDGPEELPGVIDDLLAGR